MVLAQPTPRVALTAFARIVARWGLEPKQAAKLLGRSDRTVTYRYAERPGRLPADVLERISLLVGIYEDVRLMFGSGPIADEWLKRPHRDFGGRAPLDRMLAGNVADLVAVRRYLGIARQGLAPGAP